MWLLIFHLLDGGKNVAKPDDLLAIRNQYYDLWKQQFPMLEPFSY